MEMQPVSPTNSPNVQPAGQQQMGQPLVPPYQTRMADSAQQAEEESGRGASMENNQSICLGKAYEKACCCCAGFGCSGNLTTIPQGSVGVITEFGRYVRTLPPGRHRFNIMSEQIIPVNLKAVCLDVPPQVVMTKDNLQVQIDAVTFFKVFDARKAVFNVDNYAWALGNLAQVTLRTVLSENSLAEMFADRQRINHRLQELMDEASDPWGIKVTRVDLKKIEIDDAMQRAMAAKAEATQEAEAKIIQAQAQRDSAMILTKAAEKMNTQKASMKLQWFETLRIISTQGRNCTVLVPDSMDLDKK